MIEAGERQTLHGPLFAACSAGDPRLSSPHTLAMGSLHPRKEAGEASNSVYRVTDLVGTSKVS